MTTAIYNKTEVAGKGAVAVAGSGAAEVVESGAATAVESGAAAAAESGAEAVIDMVADVVAGSGAAFSDAYVVASVALFTIYKFPILVLGIEVPSW